MFAHGCQACSRTLAAICLRAPRIGCYDGLATDGNLEAQPFFLSRDMMSLASSNAPRTLRLLGCLILTGFHVMPAAAGVPPEVWYSPCDTLPVAGMEARPIDASAPAVCAATASRQTPGCAPGSLRPRSAVRQTLERWAAASQDHLPIPSAERLRQRYEHPQASGAELELLAELQGPVAMDDLMQRFQWSVLPTADGVTVLKGQPLDPLDRLLCPVFCLSLDAATARPVALAFGNATGTAAASIALSPWVEQHHGVSLRHVAYSEETPAAQPIRTADLSDDTILPTPAGLALPPLPVTARQSGSIH